MHHVPADGLEDELLAALLREQGFAAAASTSAIPARRTTGDAPVSSQQRRLWFLSRLDPENASYVIPGAVRVTGALDVGVLQQAFDALVRRHESLRTTIADRAGMPVQVVHEPTPVPLQVDTLPPVASGEREQTIRDLALAAIRTPFDLERGPLLRVRVLRVDEDDHLVVLAMHHIVSDGWSVAVLIRELVELYDAIAFRRAPALNAPGLQYADFAAWQQEWRGGPDAARQVRFWTSRLADLPQLALPTDRPRGAVATYAGATVRTALDATTTDAVRRFCRESGATLFMTLVSAFAALLHRYTGQADLSIGTPSANRNRAELEGVIGLFVNSLVLRADASGAPSFATLVARMKAACLDAWANQDIPFEDIVEALRPERTANLNPLFQVMFVLQNAPEGRLELPGLTFEPVDLPTDAAKFDLSLYAVEGTDDLSLAIEFNRDLLDETTAARMLEHYTRVLAAAVAAPQRAIVDLPMLSDHEQAQLAGWNRTQTAYPRGRSIHALFAEQAARTPDAIAVRAGAASLTYAELDARANQLANRLSTIAAPGAVIGLAAERSLEMIVGLLGILKAGHAYLPLDASQPAQRLRFLIEDAAVTAAVCQPSLAGVLPLDASALVLLDGAWMAIADEPISPPADAVAPMDLAYVTFTSGSTGIPKGVAVPHRAVVRLVVGTDYVSLAPGEVVLQFAPLAFDASTFEIWGALLNGATLAMFSPGTPSLAELARGLAESGVTTAWLTAGLFHQMVDHEIDALARLRQVIAGGDILSVPHVRRLLDAAPHLRFVNGFGPTETTTFACCYPVTAADALGQSVPIGAPIANTTAYILDERSRELPVGVPGELFIGGDAVARGYVERPDLTAERFVPDPFATEPGARMYRTGDLARWRPDGAIEFIGRRDFQVKVRGFRIEPGEIETALTSHPAVRDAVVVAQLGDAGDKRLVAYIAADEGADTKPEALRAFLQARLPDYMVPSALVRLDALPLTANGKVDRAALPAPGDRPIASTDHIAPRTDAEVAVARIWADLLGAPRVGVHDNFFELGGHSLVATQVVARLRDELGVDIPLRTLFVAPTVEALAADVTRAMQSVTAEREIQSIPRSAARTRPRRESPTT